MPSPSILPETRFTLATSALDLAGGGRAREMRPIVVTRLVYSSAFASPSRAEGLRPADAALVVIAVRADGVLDALNLLQRCQACRQTQADYGDEVNHPSYRPT